MNPHARIIATIGPASRAPEVLRDMVHAGLDVVRFNLAWGTLPERAEEVALVRMLAKEAARPIEIMLDLPRSRTQTEAGHTYDTVAASDAALTPQDEEFLRFAVEQQAEYVALSFVGRAEDVVVVRAFLERIGGTQKIIAKIERKEALDHLAEIVAAADLVMVARGDLGQEVPLEDIPFVQQDILAAAAAAGKPAIVATQMLLSMTEHNTPTRAEVSDVTTALFEGAWGVMLSEETASGAYPVESVVMMERIRQDTKRHAHLAPTKPGGTMGKLLIARHHESQWNHEGLWTGTRDVHLTEYGFKKSEEMGLLLRDVSIDYAFASMQVRSIETLSSMLTVLELFHVPVEHTAALNERDYGEYTGKNKWEMEQLIGKDAFEHIRRDWDCPVPGGETLKMVYERVLPFFQQSVLPLLAAGKNVLIVSHGNALRALMLFIEQIPKEDAPKLEMLFGGVVLYDVDSVGHMLHKEVRQVESHVHA